MLFRDCTDSKYLSQASPIRHGFSRLITVILALIAVGNSLLAAGDSSNLPENNSNRAGDTPNSDEATEASGPSESVTPADTDANSVRLFQNFLRASGFKSRNIQHVVATGSFRYGRLDEKQFTLVETSRGDRFLELKWRFRGQDYRETLVSKSSGELWKRIAKAVVSRDGSRRWEEFFYEEIKNNKVDFRQQYNHTVVSNGTRLRAKPLDNKQSHVIAGQYAELPFQHFRSNYLLLQPFTTARESQLGYRYSGSTRLPLAEDKEVYEVINEAGQSFLFDKESWLLLKWGSPGSLAGADVEIAYSTTSFKRWDGAIFPSQIKLIANGVAAGVYTIDHVSINGPYDLDLGSH
ncbi:MAG: hypothetical protein GVY36_09840 [Verrucomicrobia bacterium]|jgi:hypothetical protein|nr:hypothetical protein [Verrucomicrobiota bacterium]